MQHSPAMHSGQRFDGVAVIGVVMFVVMVLLGLLVSWQLARPAAPASAPATPAALSDPAQTAVLAYIQAHNIPVAPAALSDPAQTAVLAYIQAHSVAARAEHPFDGRSLSDQAGYVATVGEYINTGLDEDYLPQPAAAGRGQERAASRFFADEMAGATQMGLMLSAPAAPEPATPLAGPR